MRDKKKSLSTEEQVVLFLFFNIKTHITSGTCNVTILYSLIQNLNERQVVVNRVFFQLVRHGTKRRNKKLRRSSHYYIE